MTDQYFQQPQQAQQANFYGQEVEEDEFDDQDEELDLIPGDYGQQQGIMEEGQDVALAEAQLQAQLEQAAAALASVPDPVKKYIVLFYQAIQNNSIQDVSSAYEANWSRLTEKFYAKSEWPEAETIAPLVNDDQKFLTLYRELWYRHVYSRLSPDGEDRFHSYDNYCDFFNFVLNSEGPVGIELPAQWLWDIIDEFIYQFQSYSQWRSRVENKSEEELTLLQDGGVWSSYSVLNVLYSLIQKSRILEQLEAQSKGQDTDEVAGEFGARPLYKQLGYFSIVGLLRVHVLLGDYTLALKMLDQLNLHNKAPAGGQLINRVTACHVTIYYYVGFSYMMLRRYPDAIRAFSHILVFIMRLKQYHTRSYQYDQINKTADRMCSLLAICCALCPTRLDENIQNNMKEKYGEQINKMLKGGNGTENEVIKKEALASFEELFLYSCPKFIIGNSPPYHDQEALSKFIETPQSDPSKHQLKIFLSQVETQLSNSNIRSFLRLYTTLGTDKLAKFLEIDEEEVVEMMMVMKASTRSLKWTQGGLLEGEPVNTSDLDFAIDDNMVHIAESRVGRRFGDWFLRNGTRMHDVLTNIKSKPLPVVVAPAANAVPTATSNLSLPANPLTSSMATGASGGDKKKVNFAKDQSSSNAGGAKPWGNATAKSQVA